MLIFKSLNNLSLREMNTGLSLLIAALTKDVKLGYYRSKYEVCFFCNTCINYLVKPSYHI